MTDLDDREKFESGGVVITAGSSDTAGLVGFVLMGLNAGESTSSSERLWSVFLSSILRIIGMRGLRLLDRSVTVLAIESTLRLVNLTSSIRATSGFTLSLYSLS